MTTTCLTLYVVDDENGEVLDARLHLGTELFCYSLPLSSRQYLPRYAILYHKTKYKPYKHQFMTEAMHRSMMEATKMKMFEA